MSERYFIIAGIAWVLVFVLILFRFIKPELKRPIQEKLLGLLIGITGLAIIDSIINFETWKEFIINIIRYGIIIQVIIYTLYTGIKFKNETESDENVK